MKASRISLLLILVASGLLVGTLVAAVSVGTAAPFCPSGLDGESCRGLVVTLAKRAGLVAGAATVIMVLLVAGLLRMLAQDDRDRATRAREAYLASRSSR
ncbi:MAG TPA: hypothetical protein VG602_03735 [Actinomycetota bacterium]|nr:hypothetical protein [Actinomycetota bacterium]